jgi:hypothetical protein
MVAKPEKMKNNKRWVLRVEPAIYVKNVKVYGKIFTRKDIDQTCPCVPQDFENDAIIKAPLKHIIMQTPRYQQRYAVAWVDLVDKKIMRPVTLVFYEDTMRFHIRDGINRCNVAYDAGYDYVPAYVTIEKQESEFEKQWKTFDCQQRNLFERMQLPEKLIPEKCQHRSEWSLRKKHGARRPRVCHVWCDFESKCFKDLVGIEMEKEDCILVVPVETFDR